LGRFRPNFRIKTNFGMVADRQVLVDLWFKRSVVIQVLSFNEMSAEESTLE